MFGDTYFATRKALLDTVADVEALAREVGADPGELQHKERLMTGLMSPFLFVVCGEVNAGKSTLLNGLFGQELCKTNVLPETDKVQWFRYGSLMDKSVTSILEECYREVEFLMDFNLVDTPGTNSVVRGHQKITERFLPVADLLLFVFPVSNPWGAATWDFLSRLGTELIDKVVIVVQQADLRDERDIEVILGHMRELAQQRLGRIPPIFAVSAKRALEAKKTMPFARTDWEASGYPQLEQFISAQVAAAPDRRRLLGRIHASTGSALRSVETQLQTAASGIEEKARYIASLEDEIEQLAKAKSTDVLSDSSALVDSFADVTDLAQAELSEGLRPIASLSGLFRGERLPERVETVLESGSEELVENAASADVSQLVKFCESHWRAKQEEIESTLGIRQPDFAEAAAGFASAKSRFIREMARSSERALKSLKLRASLDLLVARRQLRLKAVVMGVLALIAAGGICGALDVALPVVLILFVFATGLALWGLGSLQKSRKEIIEAFDERCGLARREFPDLLTGDYKEGVRRTFSEYGQLLEEIRRAVGRQKHSLAPRLERWNELFLRYKSVEQEL